MNIAGILHDQAMRLGGADAIVERGRTISFAALDRAATAAAADLADAGVKPGMRALVFSPMSIALYATIIGLFRLRATAVFLDPSAGRARLAASIRRVEPDAFVAVGRAHLLRVTSAEVRTIPIKLTIRETGRIGRLFEIPRAPAEGDALAVAPCDPLTPAIITFTSGSTGEPKAVVRTHGFLVSQHRALVESLALAPGEVDLTTLPVFLLANLASGVTSVIPDADLRAPGAIDAGPVLAQIRQTRPDRTVASPAFLERLSARTSARREKLESFARIYTGGAPVFPRTLDAIAAAAPRAAVVGVYGSTEAEPIAEIDRRSIAPDDRAAMERGAGLLAGPPVRSIHLRVLPDRWGEPLGPWSEDEIDRRALKPDAPGEIVVSGEHVLTGYLDGRGDAETKIRAGNRVWHRTGDAGYLDGQGRLWLLGRCAARVSDGHGDVYPFAVECAASAVGAVRRSAFVLHGGRRVLVVELQGDAGAARRELGSRLAWARLAEIAVVPRIPVDRRHNAKVEYPALRRMLDRSLTR